MCGILGWIRTDGGELSPAEFNQARQALDTMAHRGPDFQGQWTAPAVYLGHNRLSVLDLNPEANQPFHSDDDRHALIYNGEIYNYVELRDELAAMGSRFRTTSDTEVLLEAYRHWGAAAFERFDGMFAFGLHDRQTGRHVLCRDPLGQKPLYYHAYAGGIVYASELRALLALPGFSWRLDRDTFLKFLFSGYHTWDTTPLAGVKKLLPGHYLTIDGGAVRMQRYWDSIPGDDPLDISVEEAGEEFRRLFDRSCRISLRSDVPYGVFLSGGVDSSMVLGSCKNVDDNIGALCVAMGEQDFNELSKAETVSRHLGVKNLRSYSMDQQSVQDAMDRFFEFSDEPHADPGFVNAYFLAKSCRPHITVALAGDGADELFCGYAPFFALAHERKLSAIPGPLMSLGRWIARNCLPGSDTYLGLQFKALAFLGGFPGNDATRFPLWLGAVRPEQLAGLCPWREREFFSPFGASGTLLEDFAAGLAPVAGRSRAQMFLYFYQKFFLPEFVCMHTDRAAMQSSLEVRSPFLSVPLIEFANRLPDHLKMHDGQLKVLLKDTMRRDSYPESIHAQRKQGFTFPLARWLKSVLRDRMEDLLSPASWPDGLIDHALIDRIKLDHLRGAANNYRILYHLMVFAQWLRNFPQVKV